ncbi:hypothetical protein DNTS_021166 [Danionella cerebrum]|uniref:Protein LYRIC-like n=1 Tax=Danionella cerebrum TaxID=2873325 RepID=A0A553R1K0_9TELE|nr:hypothetical protein DNTS_021166 [Danionella translucida]
MAPSWQDTAVQHVEQVTGYVRGALATALVYLKSELGLDLGLNPDVCAPWLVLVLSGLGLVIMLMLCASVFRCFPKGLSGKGTRHSTGKKNPTPPFKKADEIKKKNRKNKNAEKKGQRNGLPVEPQEEVKDVNDQEQDMKLDKTKKNKKKTKAVPKEKKSSAPVSKEPDEGAWETRVSNREKRQLKRKDNMAPGDGSNSPRPSAEDSRTSGADGQSIVPSSAFAAPLQKEAQVEPPQAEACFLQETVAPQELVCCEEVQSVKGSGWSEADPPQSSSEGCSAMTVPTEHRASEPSVWPQDMEGSWTIVDGSQIPVSFGGLSAVSELNQSLQPAVSVDDEWSGIHRSSADPSCDWNAPSEEWGNYVEQQQVRAEPQQILVPDQTQDSDYEKDGEDTSAPGSGKAKKKKKKKKKVEDTGAAAQVKEEVTPVTQTASAPTAGRCAEYASHVPASAPVQTQQTISGLPELTDPSQKKPDETLESLKPAKKKKARRET